MKISSLITFIVVVILIGCGRDKVDVGINDSKQATRSVASNSNCMCTQNFNPVCGSDFQDYANACEAACNGIEKTYPVSCNKLNCNPLSKKICAQPECEPGQKCSPKLYENECEMIRDNARFIRERSCS